MSFNKNLFDLGNIIYYLAYSLWAVLNIVQLSTIQDVLPFYSPKFCFCVGLFVSIILFVKLIFFTSYTFSQFIKMILIMLLFSLIIIVSRSDISLFVVVIFVLSAKNVDFKKIAAISFITLLLMIILINALAISGDIENSEIVRYDLYAHFTLSVRYGMGFNHPNIYAYSVLSLMCSWIYIRFYKLKWIEIIFAFVVSSVIHVITDSRMSYYISIALILMIVIFKIAASIKKIYLTKLFNIYKSVGFVVFPVCAVISIVFSVLYKLNIPFVYELDGILSKRIDYASLYYHQYGIHLFGQPIDSSVSQSIIHGAWNNLVLDNAYMNYIIRYGLIFIIFAIASYCILAFTRNSLSDIPLIVLMIVMAVSGLSDNFIIYLPYNITIISLSSLLFSRRNNADKVNDVLPVCRLRV